MRYYIENRRKKKETKFTRELVLYMVMRYSERISVQKYLDTFGISIYSMKRYIKDLDIAYSLNYTGEFYFQDEYSTYGYGYKKHPHIPYRNSEMNEMRKNRLRRVCEMFEDYYGYFRDFFKSNDERVYVYLSDIDDPDEEVDRYPLTARDFYSAGASPKEKRQVQRDFLELMNAAEIAKRLV